jgi:di/tricarboxylate transporter
MNQKSLGLTLGVAVAAILYLLPLEGLSQQGRACLSLTLMTVIFWAFQIAQAGYISGLLLGLMVICKVADPATVFSAWTGTTMYLIIGAYLIASAVKHSGLGERIAYWFILHVMRSYRSVIIAIFAMTFILSILIPHPWPRAFLIMSVMGEVIKNAKIGNRDATHIGYAVFAASVPVSAIFLTGDSTINPLVAQYAGVHVGWFDWLRLMGVPGIVASVLICAAFLLVFRPGEKITIDKESARIRLTGMGKLNTKEILVLGWLSVAIVLWATDSLHGIDIGWVTLIVAMLMAMPIAGGLLTPQTWSEVPVQVLVFITAAIAIGRVGGATGMNQWIAATLLPSAVPGNPLLLAVMIGGIAVILHMLLGSVIAVMGVAIPAILAYTLPMGINPLAAGLFVLTAVVLHYVFPFQNMNILVGIGEENGGFSQKETLRFTLPLLLITFIIMVLVEVPWWMLLGIL